MADFISELAAKSGISPDQARKGVGAVLALLKDRLPPGVFSKVQAAVPNADSMMAAAPPAEGASGGGILGTVASAVGKLTGGGGATAELTSRLAQLGISAEQLQKFLSAVVEFFKRRLPEDAAKQVGALVPASEPGS
jgi:uncharacterized protein (DUF2267 family)